MLLHQMFSFNSLAWFNVDGSVVDTVDVHKLGLDVHKLGLQYDDTINDWHTASPAGGSSSQTSWSSPRRWSFSTSTIPTSRSRPRPRRTAWPMEDEATLDKCRTN
jgi:hypothetical protein